MSNRVVLGKHYYLFIGVFLLVQWSNSFEDGKGRNRDKADIRPKYRPVDNNRSYLIWIFIQVGCNAHLVDIFQVLLEFKEYAAEVDVNFVRKVACAIDCCVIKLERVAEWCILCELINVD